MVLNKFNNRKRMKRIQIERDKVAVNYRERERETERERESSYLKLLENSRLQIKMLEKKSESQFTTKSV